MSRSRQALVFSVIYSLPLLIWLIARLQYIDWEYQNPQFLFRQTLAALVLLQALAIVLLFVNQPATEWQDDALAIIHILLFPLPLLTLTWMSGGAHAEHILLCVLLAGSAGAITFLVQSCGRLIPAVSRRLYPAVSLLHILLAILIWNFREHWWSWLEL